MHWHASDAGLLGSNAGVRRHMILAGLREKLGFRLIVDTVRWFCWSNRDGSGETP